MNKTSRYWVVVLLAFLVFASLSAFGQEWRRGREWDQGRFPRDGVCFFRAPHFRGDYFCARPGDSFDRLEHGFNGHIRSIRVFGRAAVIVYAGRDYRGDRAWFDRDMDDLRDWPLPGEWRGDWGNRVYSFEVVSPRDRERFERDRDDYYHRDRDDYDRHRRDDDGNLLYFHLNLGGHD